MRSPFTFEGEIGRATYALWAAAALLAPHAFIAVAFAIAGQPFTPTLWFWLNPLRLLVGANLPWWAPAPALLTALGSAWVLAAISFRRARTIHCEPAFAQLAVIPIAQIFVALALVASPTLRPREDEEDEAERGVRTRSILLGMVTGIGLTVAAVALIGVAMGQYGYALFVTTPFVIGAVTTMIANRGKDLRFEEAYSISAGALLLGALALMVVALEGMICIVFASPLIILECALGVVVGLVLSRHGNRRHSIMMSLAILPLTMLGETAAPPQAAFESVETINIDASPREVWQAVTHMGPIPDAPAPPFSWGLAYPMRGEIQGEGVGAIRRGVFSTGVAYERVTVWEPERKLDFIVLSDPPTMHEISPYAEIHAPHLNGYFRTRDARFTITPLANGQTQLTLATHHELELAPAIYWAPIAQWAVHANKERVLTHFRNQAEAYD